MQNLIPVFGAFYGFMAIAMGAFAAHGLKDKVPAVALGWIKTASEYQMLHAVLIVVLGVLVQRKALSPDFLKISIVFLCGIFFFSGSLYAMALTGVRQLGAITPIGGVLLLCAWAWLGLKLTIAR